MEDRMFAITILEEERLRLWLRIRRAASGDIYYLLPNQRAEADWKKWNPHGSWHRSGAYHHKSFNHKSMAQQRQKPDWDFAGTENFITLGIASDEIAFLGTCERSDFAATMEIPSTLLGKRKYETLLSIDLAGGEADPIITPGAKILARKAFDDERPIILATFFQTS
jgi:hypothetical protein